MRPGTSYAPRVVVRSRSSGCSGAGCERGLGGAEVTARLGRADAKKDNKLVEVIATRTATSDDSGSVDLALAIPEELPDGDLVLELSVRHPDGQASSRLAMKAVREAKVLLSTDKPIYQPGQRIYIRLLARETGSGHAASGVKTQVVVFDAKNNKVFQQKGKASPEGVYATQLDVAALVNTGRWRIEATVGDTKAERTLEVKPYVLPKFKVEVGAERASYRPGELVKGTISGRYFFGEPLRKAKVKLSVETFDVEAHEVARMDFELDQAGAHAFELRLPDALVGLPMLQGAASVRLVATVTDTAGQTQEGTKTLTIYQDPLRVTAVPEAGALVSGVENIVYLVVTTPDGAPAPRAKLDVRLGASAAALETDASGIAEWRLVPSGAVVASIDVKTPDGAQSHADVNLAAAARGGVLLRPSDTAPKAGERLDFDVLVQRAVPHAFLDLVKDGQTLLTLSAPVRDGHARMSAVLPADVAGTVLAHAYVIGDDMDVYADTRPLVVRMADDLNIAVVPSKARFLPGEEATLDLAVTDRQGHPVLAVLGLWVVDEAVFALSELRPGMEQVFFLLEQEIMRPKIEIHAFEPDEVFIFDRLPRPSEPAPLAGADRRSRAAAVLAGAAMPQFAHPLSVDSMVDARAKSVELWQAELERKTRVWKQALKAWVQEHWRAPRGKDVARALAAAGLRIEKTRDPFGNAWRLSVEPDDNEVSDVSVMSAGRDGQWGTGDDFTGDLGLSASLEPVWRWQEQREAARWGRRGIGAMEPMMMMGDGGGGGGGWGIALGGVGAGGGGQAFAVNRAEPAPPMMGKRRVIALDAIEINGAAPVGGGGEGASSAVAPPRVREYFPETLLVEPLILTDASGHAKVTFPMADSITTWRLSALASTSDGRLGSVSRGLEVFQDFFVDISFPVSLTRGDEVTVPVAVYNYLPTAQTVKLRLDTDGGLEVKGGRDLQVELAAGEVKGVQVPLVASRVGMGRLTVTANGSKMADAVRREVKVEPDGFPVEQLQNGMLSDALDLSIDVPQGAIDQASLLQVKLFPGMFAQVMDGLEGMLQMPSGCFEQTSSTTYPNILVLNYLRDSKRAKPELEATALRYLQAGWQRLVTFEVAGGGFSWFGDAPANRVLTAYGLMEFHDMDKVYAIDDAVVARTRQWLTRQQQADGSWQPDAAFLHQDSWGDMQKSSLLVSAYVTWSLAVTRPDRKQLDAPLAKALAFLAKNVDKADDAYVLGYLGNAFAEALTDRNDAGQRATLRTILAKLAALAVRDGDKVHFPTKQRTAMYGSGDSATIEVTALALRAFMKAGEQLDLVKPGLAFLVGKKSAGGQWETTQATVQVLQSMVASLSTQQAAVAGTVDVLVNDEKVASASYTPDDFDVVRFIDASKALRPGANKVRLVPSPGLKAMFQASATSYLPWSDDRRPTPEKSAFDVTVGYDRTTLAKDDIVGVTVRVKSNLPGTASMGMVDVAVPPGFEVLSDDLEAAVAAKTIQRFSLAGRQVILYVEQFRPDAAFELKFRVRARFPVKVSTGASKAWEYYNPDHVGVALPGALKVQ
ncbi:MAG: alpha-2-macroglobulin family protein [Myxococcota bacterium]